MRIKTTIVAYALSVQHFKNTTVILVAYVGLRVNAFRDLLCSKLCCLKRLGSSSLSDCL